MTRGLVRESQKAACHSAPAERPSPAGGGEEGGGGGEKISKKGLLWSKTLNVARLLYFFNS